MKYFAVVLFILFVNPLISQHFYMKGRADEKPNARVRVITYADQFSMLEKTVAETFTDATGRFSLEGEISEVTFGFLALNLEKSQLYLSPSATYEIDIPYQDTLNSGSVFDRLPLQFSIQIADDQGLQDDIGLFNQLYNEFIYNNAQAVYRSRNKAVLDGFRTEIEERFADRKSPYLKNYIHYAFVSLDWIGKRTKDHEVLKNEIVDKPVLDNNIQYTDFFKAFFDNYLKNFVNGNYNLVVDRINFGQEYKEVLALLQQDTLLASNQEVAELVFTLLLSDMYYSADINKQSVILKLKQLARASSFALVKNVATHFVVRLTALDYGYQAPEINLKNLRGDLVDSDSFKGKFTLISWTTDNCPKCVYDQGLIGRMLPSFNDSVNLLVLHAGIDPKMVGEIAPNEKKHTQWVMVPDTSLLPEKFQIKTFPAYMLINPDGTMAYQYIPAPEEGMELYIRRFMTRYNK
jgi:hypothetical protein